MWPRFGIKVANSTLCIAHSKSEGRQEIIANSQGDRVSQACLFWNGAETECGLTAKQKMANQPQQAVANSFQLLVPNDELPKAERLDEVKRNFPSTYDAESNSFKLTVRNPHADDAETKLSITPHEVHVELFRAELELAGQYVTDKESRPIAVLAAPNYYTQTSYASLAAAAKQAGFHVAQIISEPAAAVLAYGIIERQSLKPRTVVTVKCGGLYTEVVLFSICQGYLTELRSFAPARIGGIDFTNALVQHICAEFQRKYRLDANESRRALAKIRNAANNCKHELSTMQSTQIYIDSVMDGYDFNLQMSRARFSSYVQPVVSSIEEYVLKCLAEEQVQSIDDVVLLGGTMQIPMLNAAIARILPFSMVHQHIPADEVVALGCATQAGLLTDPKEELLDKANRCVAAMDDLYFWHGDDPRDAQVIVSEGTILPVTNQCSVAIRGDSDVFTLRVGTNTKKVKLNWQRAENAGNTLKVQADVSPKTVDGKISTSVKFSVV